MKRHFLMFYVRTIMVLLLAIRLLPVNAQSSKNRDQREEYSRIFYILNGKVGTAGNTDITYYTGDFYPEIKGKVKSVGNIDITYYTGDFYPEIRGKVKSVGKSSITYYTGDFYPEIKGKLKAVGDANITYYTGDFYPEIKGKVKSVKGNFPERILSMFPELVTMN